MPITALTAILASLSMAGMPPLFGFVAKELLYEANVQAPHAAPLITSAGLFANMFMVAIAGIICLDVFFGKRKDASSRAHEPSVLLWSGPLILAALGMWVGVAPENVGRILIQPALAAIRPEVTEIKLKLWHGFSPILVLGIVTYLLGIFVFALQGRIRALVARLAPLARFGPERTYDAAIDGLIALARWQTRVLQNGYLRVYLLVIVLSTVGLVGWALVRRADAIPPIPAAGFRFHDVAVAAMILAAASAAALTRSRLTAILALGVVGYGAALLFAQFGAPDLAMTQFLVETLTVILFVLLLRRLPRFERRTPAAGRLRDAGVAIAAGATVSVLTILASSVPVREEISRYFAEASWPEAYGRNVVNVILVDFRALDTLGEITVLAVAGLGVYALMRLRGRHERAGGSAPAGTGPRHEQGSQSGLRPQHEPEEG
jgi:multicomponent Na+:H+ antiporter subunit A